MCTSGALPVALVVSCAHTQVLLHGRHIRICSLAWLFPSVMFNPIQSHLYSLIWSSFYFLFVLGRPHTHCFAWIFSTCPLLTFLLSVVHFYKIPPILNFWETLVFLWTCCIRIPFPSPLLPFVPSPSLLPTLSSCRDKSCSNSFNVKTAIFGSEFLLVL